MTKKRRKHASHRILRFFAVLVILVSVAVPAGLIVPQMFGIVPYTVISGSMEPAIPTGSIVYVKKTQLHTIESGEVITFYMNTNAAVPTTHRVVENHTDTQEFITKGDANEKTDIVTIPYAQVEGKVILSVPMMGYLVGLLNTRGGFLIWTGIFLAGILLLSRS